MHLQTRIRRASMAFAITITVIVSGINASPFVQKIQEQKQASLKEFNLVADGTGWILLDQQLFWTSDGGQSWTELGPSVPSGALVQDVQFAASGTGWVLWTNDLAGRMEFQLSQTDDRGATWSTRPLSLPASEQPSAPVESAQMGWFGSQAGWLAARLSTGSNFSVGTLYTTADGGTRWEARPLPVADNVYFVDPNRGWATGGPDGGQVFYTQDAGIHWTRIDLPDEAERGQTMVYPPRAIAGGVLGLVELTGGNMLTIYALDVPSDSWLSVGQTKVEQQPGQLGISILDLHNLVAVIPGTSSIVRVTDGQAQVLKNQDQRSSSITELDMLSLTVGWAKSVESKCLTKPLSDPGTASISCTSTTRLLQTRDGGITWQDVSLPLARSGLTSAGISSSLETVTVSSITNLSNTAEFLGQGFDRCEIPTLSQMHTWRDAGPYMAVNLYIGGSSRACDNTPLSSSYIFQLNQQGWKFFPTWVGPQAPCNGFSSKISYDVTTAHDQGVSEADLAVERLAELGLTGPAKTGSVIYYDIEYYSENDDACRAAVNAFMNGWVTQIRARGNLAGVYGSTRCNTGISDYRTINNVPDVIWPARWYHNIYSGYYDSTADVWDLGSCIPNTAWADHQRIRQYEGDHNESWGDLTLEIDSDAIDGVLAFPFDYPYVSSIVRADADPTNGDSVAFKVTFSKSVAGVNKGDFSLTPTGVANASITGLSGSGSTYTVTVSTGSGDGSIRLDLIDDDSIHDASYPLGGSGLGNGNYKYGETYTIFKSTFADVRSDYWAWDFVERLFKAGVTTGCSTNPMMYCPEYPVTRAQMAVFLLRSKHGSSYSPPDVAGDSGFADVPPDYWAGAWIKELSAEGITSGCGGGNYCPELPVTRSQMAVFLLKSKYGISYSPPELGGDSGFLDVPPDYWAAAWIKQLAAEGITSGCGGGNYCPETSVTRAQMAVFLVRNFNLP